MNLPSGHLDEFRVLLLKEKQAAWLSRRMILLGQTSKLSARHCAISSLTKIYSPMRYMNSTQLAAPQQLLDFSFFELVHFRERQSR